MPTRVTKQQRKAAKKLPKVVTIRGQETVAEVTGPGALLGEPMSKPDSVGKAPAEESGELIVWHNRQKTS